MKYNSVPWIALFALALITSEALAGEPPVPIGVATVDITPGEPIRLVGYGSRTTESEGIEQRLKANALAIGGDAEWPAVLLAIDNLGVPAHVTDEVAARLKTRAGLPRERLVFCSTHTHCGPALSGTLGFIFGAPIPEDQQGRIDRYTRDLTDALEKVALEALADRKPGQLAWARGQVAFAANRRVLKDGRWVGFGVNPDGPVDHSLPVLRVTDPDGKLRAVLVGYACHCTTLGGEFNKVCGDWAGYACEAIERAHPGAVALVAIGCGADANPDPRRDLDDAKQHGAAVAREVERLLETRMAPLSTRIVAQYRRIELPFGPLPNREQLADQTKRRGAEGYFARIMLERLDRGERLSETLTYPVQTWCFGDALAMVFLGGEVVVDYALRLNRECDAERLWVSAYSNDVPCYIASKRLMGEGGYEVDASMVYYGRPTRLAPEAEDRIVAAVHDLLPDSFDQAASQKSKGASRDTPSREQLPKQADGARGRKAMMRIGAAQPRSRLIDYSITNPAEVLTLVDRSLGELEQLVHKAGSAKCDAIAFPEDTLGLGKWEAAHKSALREVLPGAIEHMLERLGRAAASHRIYLICCNDTVEPDGSVHNTAFFLGRDGREIGHYHKVNMPIHELDRKRGNSFPVFSTPDLGGVGMLICYDMVFPEAPRCLALGGADIIFHPTLGGAAIGDDDISRAAFRTRAAENFVYLVVSQRGGGSMIISPQGKIVAEGHGPDDIAIAQIDPSGGREGGDAMNSQSDMRARLFRERSPAAFSILTDTNPPVLAKVPETITVEEAVAISSKVLTVGDARFQEADALVRQGKTNEAIAAFEKLRSEFRDSWIDRVAQERLIKLHSDRSNSKEEQSDDTKGLAAKYPGDAGIERDSHVLFAENFETGSIQEVGKRWGSISNEGGKVMAFSSDSPSASAGARSLQMTATLGENTGGHLYTRLPRGEEKVFARFYVKFAADAGYIHHFVTLGGYNPPTSWPQGGAGERPRGDDRFTAGIEPYGSYGKYAAPGAWNFYAYWPEMKVSADGKYWGQSLTALQPALVPRDRWQCVEVMLQCNSAPDKSDGALALWLDGQPVARFSPGARRSPWTGMGFSLTEQEGEPFEGFRWRTSPDLKINFFWLLHYVTDHAARTNNVASPNSINRVSFDDIVISTAYVGPIQERE